MNNTVTKLVAPKKIQKNKYDSKSTTHPHNYLEEPMIGILKPYMGTNYTQKQDEQEMDNPST